MNKQNIIKIKGFLKLNLDNFISNHIFQDDKNINTDFISIGKGKSRTRKGKIAGEKEKIYTQSGIIPINYNKFEHKLLIKLRDDANSQSNRYRKISINLENKKLIGN